MINEYIENASYLDVREKLPPIERQVIVCCSSGDLIGRFYTISKIREFKGTGLEKQALKRFGRTEVWEQEYCNPNSKVMYWKEFDRI